MQADFDVTRAKKFMLGKAELGKRKSEQEMVDVLFGVLLSCFQVANIRQIARH